MRYNLGNQYDFDNSPLNVAPTNVLIFHASLTRPCIIDGASRMRRSTVKYSSLNLDMDIDRFSGASCLSYYFYNTVM